MSTPDSAGYYEALSVTDRQLLAGEEERDELRGTAVAELANLLADQELEECPEILSAIEGEIAKRRHLIQLCDQMDDEQRQTDPFEDFRLMMERGEFDRHPLHILLSRFHLAQRSLEHAAEEPSSERAEILQQCERMIDDARNAQRIELREALLFSIRTLTKQRVAGTLDEQGQVWLTEHERVLRRIEWQNEQYRSKYDTLQETQ